MPVRTLHIQT